MFRPVATNGAGGRLLDGLRTVSVWFRQNLPNDDGFPLESGGTAICSFHSTRSRPKLLPFGYPRSWNDGHHSSRPRSVPVASPFFIFAIPPGRSRTLIGANFLTLGVLGVHLVRPVRVRLCWNRVLDLPSAG